MFKNEQIGRMQTEIGTLEARVKDLQTNLLTCLTQIGYIKEYLSIEIKETKAKAVRIKK